MLNESTISDTRHRVKIDCTEDGMRLIDDLVKRTGSSSRAELFRKAISVLEWAVEVEESGARIAVEEANRKEYVRLWVRSPSTRSSSGAGDL